MPDVLVTAEDVINGKPSPDCFVLAANALGIDVADCLVWEDAPAGIAAGEAAGATVIVVEATHKPGGGGEHLHVRDYRDISHRVDADGRLWLLSPDL